MPDLALGSTNGSAAPTAPIFPKRPKRRFSVDDDVVVESVLRRHREMAEDDFMAGSGSQLGWRDARTLRFMKLRGLLPDKDEPWPDCANVQLPLMQQHCLRAEAGLHNVAFSLRPLMGVKATNKGHAGRETKVAQLLDYQAFVEPGPDVAERRFTDFILGGCEDGNAVAFCDWVRDKGKVYRCVHRPPIPPGVAPTEYLDKEFAALFPGFVKAELPPLPSDPDDAPVNHVFTITYQRGPELAEAEVSVFQDDEDGALTLEVRYDATLYDGPIFTVLPITSLGVPTRVSNLQPPFAENPTGAPYASMTWEYRIDEIARKKKTGEFNYLTAEGWESIQAMAGQKSGLAGEATDALEAAKDAAEGRTHRTPDGQHEEDLGHVPVRCVWMFDRWDVNGDGLAEDVYWIVAEDAKVLVEGRYLTERWPAERPYRPLAEWCPIPVKDRWYGISFPELMEGMADHIKGVLDQMMDGWTMSQLGWGLYGQSSKVTPDLIHVRPGQLIPVPGNPRESFFWPNLPQRDVSGALGIVGMSMQILDQLMMQGPLQRGQVPTGKSQALRTTGNMAMILQQGDVRADQLLLRFFNGCAQIYRCFHRMNRHFLPAGKEFRVVGWDGPAEQGYVTLTSPTDVDVDMDFEFRPEFLNSNPETVVAALDKVLMLMMQPLAFQMGITDANLVYRTVQKATRAMKLDPRDHWKAPTVDQRPMITADEAIIQATLGQPIYAQPLEGWTEHFRLLTMFQDSEAVAMLSAHPAALGVFRIWWEEAARGMQHERMTQAVQGFAQAQNQGQAPTTPTSPLPATGTGDMTAPLDALVSEVSGGAA